MACPVPKGAAEEGREARIRPLPGKGGRHFLWSLLLCLGEWASRGAEPVPCRVGLGLHTSQRGCQSKRCPRRVWGAL